MTLGIAFSSSQSIQRSNISLSERSSSSSSVNSAIRAVSSICFGNFQNAVSCFSVSSVFSLGGGTLDLLHQTGISFQPVIKRTKVILCSGLTISDMPQLIAEDQHIAAYTFHGLRQCWDRGPGSLRQLFHRCFQLSQQGIVGLNLPVQLTTVRDHAHALRVWAVTPSWTVGCSSNPRSAWLRWSMRSYIQPAPDGGWSPRPTPAAKEQAVPHCSNAR